MSLIEPNLPGQQGLSPQYRGVLTAVAKNFVAGNGMIFLGAGINVNPGNMSFPTADVLSQTMSQECSMDWSQCLLPLSRIAYYYESLLTRELLNDLLTRTFARNNVPVAPALKNLIDVIALIRSKSPDRTTLAITTNYDRQFEKAYRDVFQSDAEVVIYRGATDPNAGESTKLNRSLSGELERGAQYWNPSSSSAAALYKMHGCISRADDRGLVITEEDYINFLANALNTLPEKTILNNVRGALTYSTILFIGYSLSDWNFRVIFKATVEKQLDKKANRSYAIQYRDPNREPTPVERLDWDSSVRFWDQKKVDIINVTGAQFTADLLDTIAKELGISLPPGEAADGVQ